MWYQRNYENKMYTYKDSRFYVQDFTLSRKVKKVAILLDGAIEIPPTCGLIYRLFHLSVALGEEGVNIVWIIRNRNFLKKDDFKRLKNYNIRMHVLPDQLFYNIEYITQIIKKESVEIVQFEVTQDCLYFSSKIKKQLNIPVVLEVHESDYLLRNSINGRENSSHFIDFIQRAAIHSSDAVVCMTKSEQIYLNERSPDKFFLVPNGVEDSFPRLRNNNPEPVILFLGNLFYYPNRQAVVFLIEKILPLVMKKIKNVRLKVIGMLPHALRKEYADLENVEFTGEIKEMQEFYRALSSGYLGICPILSGAGMKVKILNYAAGGFPIVTTPIGAMGYEELQGLSICTESPGEIAQKVIELLSSEQLARNLGALLRESVMQKYSWKSLAERSISAYSFALNSVHASLQEIKEVPPSLFFEEKRHMEKTFEQHVIIEKEVDVII